MTTGVKTIIYPVRDVAAAKALFNSLTGAEPAHDEPYYVGYRIGDQEIGLDPNGHANGMTGPLAYWHVDDVEAAVKRLEVAGAQVQQAARDVGGGKLVATVTDADGNLIGLVQSPW